MTNHILHNCVVDSPCIHTALVGCLVSLLKKHKPHITITKLLISNVIITVFKGPLLECLGKRTNNTNLSYSGGLRQALVHEEHCSDY